jgi:phosphatidylglycerol:prolipoprotein diacylglycerol transferase
MTATLAAWLHDIGPFVLRFTDHFGIRWYGLSYIAGFLIAGIMMHRMATRGLLRVPPDRVFDALVMLVGGVVIGGRLGYVFLYQPSLLWTFEPAFPFWGLLMITRGGMASHGGMLGVIVAAWLVSRGFKDESGRRVGACPPLHVMDAIALTAPIGLGLGRLANFINGELLGRVVARAGEPAPWWAVRFPQEHLSGHEAPLTASQEVELVRLVTEHRLPNDPEADWFEFAYGRVLDKLHAGSAEIAARLEPLVSARHPSQLYQLFAEGMVTLAVAWFVFRRPRKPGVVGAWFLITYGVGRVVTEFWRLPDDHFKGAGLLDSARLMGLSRGQWLSVLMVGAGVALLVVVSRRAAERMRGWGSVLPAEAGDAHGDRDTRRDQGE